MGNHDKETIMGYEKSSIVRLKSNDWSDQSVILLYKGDQLLQNGYKTIKIFSLTSITKNLSQT